MSNHWPPKVLTMVDSSAMLSPQPGLPRRHTPYRPLPGLWTLAAKARICSQVGCSGRLPPPPPPPAARGRGGTGSPPKRGRETLPRGGGTGGGGGVHRERALAIERGRIQLAVGRQTGADGCQQIVDVVPGVRLELLEPAFLAPDRRLVHADGHHVELPALRRNVRRDALAQRALLQRHPLELDVGMALFELWRELLHLYHLPVVDRGDDQFGRAGSLRCACRAQRKAQC